MFSTTVKPSLSLFCRKYFKGRPDFVMAITQTGDSPIRISHSRQATLHTAPGALSSTPVPTPQAFAQAYRKGFTHRNAGSRLIRTGSVSSLQAISKLSRTRTGLHANRVGFSMPLESALRTQARSGRQASDRASPQHPPQTGRSKQAQGVSTICPLKDF